MIYLYENSEQSACVDLAKVIGFYWLEIQKRDGTFEYFLNLVIEGQEEHFTFLRSEFLGKDAFMAEYNHLKEVLQNFQFIKAQNISRDCVLEPAKIQPTKDIPKDVRDEAAETPCSHFTEDFLIFAKDPNRKFVLELTWLEAWSVFGQLQLALKHPESAGILPIAREIALKLQGMVAITESMKEVAEEGWRDED